MWLNITWFVLYVVIIVGYVILDGFDLGVGMLSPFLAKDDTEKRILLNAIGPVWDGNEVWLVLGGGALFAAFPLVYASLFSGFYLAMMLVLLVLILRTIAIEFRSKRESQRWRSTWDWFFFGSSLGITLLLGVALGNVIRGVALDQQGNMDISLVDLLNPYSLFVGVTAVAMLCLHGSIFLAMKVEGDLLDRVKAAIPRLMAAFFVLMTALIAWTLLANSEVTDNYRDRLWIGIFPVLAFVAVIAAWRFLRKGFYLSAFISSALTDRPADGRGGRRPLPGDAAVVDRPGLRPHHHQRLLGRQHADGDVGDGGDRHPVRAALHRRRLLLLPGPGRARRGELLAPTAGPRPSHGYRRRMWPRRLLALHRSARLWLYASIALGAVGALAVVAWLLLLARVVDAVFLAGRDLAAEAPALVAMGLLLLVRAGSVHAAEVCAQRASGHLCAEVRHEAVAHLAAVGPAGLDEERVADVGVTVGHGVDALDPYTTAFLPAAALAGVVPVLVLVAVGVLDPLTTLVLFFAGPMLILLLAVIGGRTRALTERRLTEMGWLSSFYLDMVRGLPTLIAFRRAEDSADTVGEMSRRHGDTTMDVLRTAFQTSLVIEWAATAATALVAVEVSFRLIHDDLSYGTALAVLLLTPEFFVPLRRLAVEYHAGASGRVALDRLDRLAALPVHQRTGSGRGGAPAHHARPARA